jgi:hypothetical protein
VTVSTNLDFNNQLDNFKQTYAKDIKDNRPKFTIVQELLSANRDGIEVGAQVNIPVILSHQGGETYALSGSTANNRNPVGMETKDAKSDQFEITFPVRMPFGLISKSLQSKAARFADKARLMLLAGDTGAKRGNELALLHGSNSIGKVQAVGAVAGTGPYTLDVTFTVQSWSDGIWTATDNLPFDVYSALTAGTKRNATTDFTVSAIDKVNRKITFQSTSNTELAAVAANDFLFSASAYGTQLPGLIYQSGLAAAVTHLGISTNYSLWRPSQVAVTGPITFGKLVSGLSPAVSSGVDGELIVLASARNWADLLKDAVSARRMDVSYNQTKLKNGAKALEYSYSGGDLRVILHPFMKDGEVIAFPTDNWFRAGSDPEPTMKLDDINLTVMSSAANVIEWRFWSAQTLVPNCLATTTLFSGITPNPN